MSRVVNAGQKTYERRGWTLAIKLALLEGRSKSLSADSIASVAVSGSNSPLIEQVPTRVEPHALA
ncbi:MAG: hypothetical protein H6822_05700 [Planctomycetaceae bacterium]|nr:hypothetical protein [Planctomycetales bacterium]MCB9921653.1 hypothetical protein [Planctomycetaceae bacterium]